MEEYKRLLSSFTRLKKRYKSLNCPDETVELLMNEIREAFSEIKLLSGNNQKSALELATKIKILLASTRLILNDKLIE